MNFVRRGNWYELSDCGKYAVCAARVLGKYVFTATYLPMDVNNQKILHSSSDIKECREACEKHERKQNVSGS